MLTELLELIVESIHDPEWNIPPMTYPPLAQARRAQVRPRDQSYLGFGTGEAFAKQFGVTS